MKRLLLVLILLVTLAKIGICQEVKYINIDSAIANYPDEQKIHMLMNAYVEYLYKDIKQAKVFVEKALEITNKEKDPGHLANCYYALGEINRLQGNTKDALHYLEKCLVISKKIGQPKAIAIGYNNIGNIYRMQDDYKPAMEYYLKGLKIAEEGGYKQQMADFYNNIGNIYNVQRKLTDAINYYKRSMAVETNVERNYTTLVNLGNVYISLFQYDSAQYCFEKGLEISAQKNNKIGEANSLSSLGTINFKTKAYEESMTYYFKALAIEKSLGLKNDIATSYSNIGSVHRALKNYDSASFYFGKSEVLAKETGAREILNTIKFNQIDAFKSQGKYKEAYEAQTEYMSMKDSILNADISGQMAEMETKYKTEKKEKEINLLKSEKELQKLKISQQKNQLYNQQLQRQILVEKKESKILLLSRENQYQDSEIERNKLVAENRSKEISLLKKDQKLQTANLERHQDRIDRQATIRNTMIIGSIIVLIPILILLYVYKQKITAQNLLANQTKEINKQKTNELIKDKELEKMRASIEGQERERARIAKDLHDGLGGTLAGIKLRLMKIAGNDNVGNQLDNVIKNIDATCEEVRTISHDLIPPKISNIPFVNLLEKYIQEVSTAQQWSSNVDCYPEEELNQIPEEIKIEIYRIIQELLNNISKHAKATQVDVNFTKHDGHLNLMVEDNGKGFNQEENSGGIGIRNMKNRVKTMNGDISIDSQINRGTIINIDIPYPTDNKLV